VTYRNYTLQDLTKPGETVTGLQLAEVQMDVGGATATLEFESKIDQAFPLPIYDEEYYAALRTP
jgi:hypothetical protein